MDNLWEDKVFNSGFDDLMNRFLNSSEYKIACSEFAGRKFEYMGDHAAYSREGGGSKIIGALAAE